MNAIDRELIELECRIADYRQPQNQPEHPMQDIERLSVSMPSKMVNEIDQYRRGCDGFPTRSAAVRELLTAALAIARATKQSQQKAQKG